jgi:hypothetical protein
MSRLDWDCPVCSQPNGADAVECVCCSCPYECEPDEMATRKDAYANPPLAEALPVSDAPATFADEEPIVPSSNFLGVFPAVPTLYHSTLVFATVYLAILAIAIPLALAFKPDVTSSVCIGAIIGAATTVSGYWKRCNMLSFLRKEKWSMTWICLCVTLGVDALASFSGIDIWNVKFQSSILFQKIGHIFYLWLSFGTNLLVGSKATPPPKH